MERGSGARHFVGEIIMVRTAQSFLETELPAFLKNAVFHSLRGPVRIEIEGPEGGEWIVDPEAAEVRPAADDVPAGVLRATGLDFIALLEGRMSTGSGIITRRLEMTGILSELHRWIDALRVVANGGEVPVCP